MKQYDESKLDLKLGSELVQLLIPHRRPLLLVDGVTGYRRAEQPTLWARRMITANEEIFAGHFPDLHLWPGIYTQEGMGQACHLLQVISTMQDAWEEKGNPAAQVLSALRNMEMGFRMHPGYRPADSAFLKELGRDLARLGMSGSVDIRFLHPVFAGQCIEYVVTRTHVLDRLARFEVEAVCEGRQVAKGRITGAIGPLLNETRI